MYNLLAQSGLSSQLSDVTVTLQNFSQLQGHLFYVLFTDKSTPCAVLLTSQDTGRAAEIRLRQKGGM